MPDTPKARLTARALLDVKVPARPSLSPDGERAVFEVAEPDYDESRFVTRLWMAEVKHEGVPARQLTFGYEGEHTPRWSPDGLHIAFLSTRPDLTEPPPPEEELDEPRDQLWVMPADGGEARRLTNAAEGVHDFEWTPDGAALIYLTEEPRPKPLQYAHDSARKRKVDPVVEHDRRLRRQFWEVGVEDRKADLLYSGDPGIHEFALAPEGGRIAFTSNSTGDPNDYHLYDLFVVDIGLPESPAETEAATDAASEPHTDAARPRDGADPPPRAEAVRLVTRPGAKFSPQWSPDGERIAFLAPLDPALSYSQECIWTVPAAGGEPANLLDGSRYDAHEIRWSKAHDAIYARAADGTNNPLVRATADGVEHVTQPGAVVTCLDYAVSPHGVVVAVLESDRTVPELYALGSGGEQRALTDLNKDFAERYTVPRQEVVRWTTDIGEVEGILVYPPDDEEPATDADHAGTGQRRTTDDELEAVWTMPDRRRATGDGEAGHAVPTRSPDVAGVTHNPKSKIQNRKWPLIVQVHGGPKGHASNTLRSYNQHAVWAAEGYLVLRPNFRGSEGYGHAFAVANRRDLGGGDFRDIMGGVDHVLELGSADSARVGIIGGSYGGYMTNWAIGQTDRFAAAISMFGIFSLVTDYSNSSLSRWDPEYMGAYYWEDPEVYRRCSPATYLDKIKTPVLILHGESDDNTFISNSKEMYQALRQRGVTCEFVHYPREGHGLHEPNHRLDEMRRCQIWFDKYLKRKGATDRPRSLEERIEHGGYELRVVRAEDAEYQGLRADEARLVEVTFALASRDAVEDAWDFRALDARLIGAGGQEQPLRGVPTDAGGGRYLVEGRDLAIRLGPDEKTGRVGVGLALTYAIPEEGGDFEFRVGDFPPVALRIGPKPPDEENAEHGAQTGSGHSPHNATRLPRRARRAVRQKEV